MLGSYVLYILGSYVQIILFKRFIKKGNDGVHETKNKLRNKSSKADEIFVSISSMLVNVELFSNPTIAVCIT